MIAADLIDTVDGIQIHSYEYGIKYKYDLTRYTVDKESRVGFGEVENVKHFTAIDEEKHSYYHKHNK